MNEDGFEAWLIKRFNGNMRLVADAMARARRINRCFGDLDVAYLNDRLLNYIDRLTYTAEDERNHRPAPQGLTFNIDPESSRYFRSIHEGLNSLRQAIELYRNYKMEG